MPVTSRQARDRYEFMSAQYWVPPARSYHLCSADLPSADKLAASDCIIVLGGFYSRPTLQWRPTCV